MPESMNKGLRVIYQGRTGTVTADYPEDWQTAGVEFDDEKGIVVQKLKKDLSVNRSEYEGFSGAGYGGAVKADAASLCKYQPGDRVKLKYNRSCGTVVKISPNGWQVSVQWDKVADDPAWEKVDDLVTMYAPRDTDPVNPNQEAIDAIEVQRTKLKKEVKDLQSRLATLTQAKRLLQRG